MNENSLIESTVCLIVRFKRPGVTRELPEDKYSTGSTDRALVRARKTIINAPEYRHVAAYEGSIKHWLDLRALPSSLYRLSTYLFPVIAIEDVDKYLERSRVEWSALVDKFVTAYPQRKAETVALLREAASEADYVNDPVVLRASFEFIHEYVTLRTPSTLKQVSAAMFAREAERTRQRLRSAEAEIVTWFRERLSLFVGEMVTMLDGGTQKGGRARMFSGRRIAKLQRFMDSFLAEGNVCGDEELAVLMRQASGLLAGADPKELKKDDTWRKSMSSSFSEIEVQLKAMTKVRGRRLIGGDEEVA